MLQWPCGSRHGDALTGRGLPAVRAPRAPAAARADLSVLQGPGRLLESLRTRPFLQRQFPEASPFSACSRSVP